MLRIGDKKTTNHDEYFSQGIINFNRTILLSILFFFLFISLGNAQNDQMKGKPVKCQCKNQRILRSGTLHIVLRHDGKDCPGLTISCPVGITCDENYDYRAYKYSDQDIDLYISFNPEVIGKHSLKSFKDNFDFMYFRIYFPDRHTENSVSYYHNSIVIRQLREATQESLQFSFDGFKDGKTQGTIEGIATEITERIESDSLDCLSGDVMGICYKYEEADIPFAIEFDFSFE